jgi:nucleoside transporter
MSDSLRAGAAAMKLRLSVMMFLQYAIWGAWLPLFWGYLTEILKFSDQQAGWLIAVSASGAVVAPFVFGQLADRRFATEKLLGLLHLLGASLMWFLDRITDYQVLLAFGFVYSLLYFPTMALTNSLAFHHLPDRDRDFPRARLWGTVGWIAVGIGMGQWILRRYAQEGLPEVLGNADAFKVAAGIGFVMGVYAFTLPHTPPAVTDEPSAVLKASRFFRRQPLATLFLISFPIACIHQFYFVHTEAFLRAKEISAPWISNIVGRGAGPMTIGQMAEILVLALIPALARRLSRKSLLIIGLLAYVARFAIFAYVPTPAAVFPALALHGLCFGCVFFVSFMIIDEETPRDVRATAQALFNLVVFGVGIIVGNIASGEIGAVARHADGTRDYEKLFAIPMWVAAGCLVALLIFYPGGRREPAALAEPVAGPTP